MRKHVGHFLYYRDTFRPYRMTIIKIENTYIYQRRYDYAISNVNGNVQKSL